MKKMMTILTLTMLILAMVLLAGCGLKGKFFKGKGPDIETFDFRKGTQGLKMEFTKGLPPDWVYAGTNFAVGLKIKNMGAYGIAQGADLRLAVPDAEAFQWPQGNERPLILEGKSPYLKEGQEEMISFPAKSVCIPYGSYRKNYTAKIQAIACYYYETVSQADICIDTQFYTRQSGSKGACQMKEARLSGGQGGPIGITGVPQPQILETGAEKVTVQLTLPIKNLAGKGVQVFNPTLSCTDFRTKRDAATKLNEVDFEVTLAGKPMKCRPAKTLKIKEAAAKGILCTIEVEKNRGAYITPILIKTKYTVLQKAIKEVMVQPPPEGGDTVDCQKMGKVGTTGSQCAAKGPGYSCRDVSTQCPNNDDTCLTQLGCVRGLCPGSASVVCCK